MCEKTFAALCLAAIYLHSKEIIRVASREEEGFVADDADTYVVSWPPPVSTQKSGTKKHQQQNHKLYLN